MINNELGGFLTLQKDNVNMVVWQSIVTIPSIQWASV